MQIEQKPTFRRAYRKLHSNQRAAVDSAIRSIIESSEAGEEKKGDLSGVCVYKFDCVNQQYLLAYEWEEGKRLLIALGPHENFYRNLKR
jgi:mRNA interferase RelE/StbE